MESPAKQGLLAQRYQLGDQLGAGSLAVVYEARDLVLGRDVAVKLLRPAAAVSRPLRARFERETRALADAHHPNLVRVFDSGADGDSRFAIMERVRGEPLAALMEGRGRLAAERALAIIDDVLTGLAALHQAGIAHRELTPNAVVITADGTTKLLDVGLARAGVAGTGPTARLAAAAYLAPEQAAGRQGDERSDVYAAGRLLVAMLAGRPDAGDLANRGASPAFAAIVSRALAKDPPARYPSARELRAALSAAGDHAFATPAASLTSAGRTAPAAAPLTALALAAAPTPAGFAKPAAVRTLGALGPATIPASRRHGRRRGITAIGLACAAVAAAAVTAWGVGGGGEPSAATRTTGAASPSSASPGASSAASPSFRLSPDAAGAAMSAAGVAVGGKGAKQTSGGATGSTPAPPSTTGAPLPSGTPSTSPTPSPSPTSPTPSPTPTPTPSPTETPSPTPSPSPTGTPGPGGGGPGGQNGNGGGG